MSPGTGRFWPCSARGNGNWTKLGERPPYSRRENELASRTHDTVTGTLSSIILLSEQQRDESRDPAQAKAWNIVNQASANALDNLHQVIDILGGDTEGVRRTQTAGYVDGQHAENLEQRLNRTTAENDDRLHVLGFPGGTCISGTHDGGGGQGGVETERLLRELYANIRDRASPDTRYRIGITLDASQALIVQANTVAADNTRRKSCRAEDCVCTASSSGNSAACLPPPSTTHNGGSKRVSR